VGLARSSRFFAPEDHAGVLFNTQGAIQALDMADIVWLSNGGPPSSPSSATSRIAGQRCGMGDELAAGFTVVATLTLTPNS
jgi:hypothetical protein